jgi:hypothetical protein
MNLNSLRRRRKQKGVFSISLTHKTPGRNFCRSCYGALGCIFTRVHSPNKGPSPTLWEYLPLMGFRDGSKAGGKS